MATIKITAGLLLRRKMRAELEAQDVRFTEHKGWFDSIFVARGTDDQMNAVQQWLQRLEQLTGVDQ